MMRRVILAPEPYHPLRELLKRLFTREEWRLTRKIEEATWL